MIYEIKVPAEPGPEVTMVRDREDDDWYRTPDGWTCPNVGVDPMDPQMRRYPWSYVVAEYGPLEDVTPKPAEPRTWDAPAVPGPEVMAIRDVSGSLWTRCQTSSYWVLASGGPQTHWINILRYGPLTDATGETER